MNFTHIIAWTFAKANLKGNKIELEKDDPLFTPDPTKYNPNDKNMTKYPSWKIGTEARLISKKQSCNLFPGKYDYQTFIGEGPKYTIKQKYDDDLGRIKKKRKENSFKIPDVPGPGSYQIIDKEHGPRYTMSARHCNKKGVNHKSVKENKASVGSYDLRKDNSFIVSSFKFDKEKRINCEINKSTLNYPGPGYYKIKEDILSTKTPKYSFSKTERFGITNNPKVQRVQTPGPGRYELKTYTGKEGIVFTFCKDKYYYNQTEGNIISPPVGNYMKNIEYVPESACKWTFNKEDKFSESEENKQENLTKSLEIRKKRKHFNYPGPYSYNPNYLKLSTKNKNPIWTSGNVPRFIKRNRNEGTDENLGPGKYDYKNGCIPTGLSYTMRCKYKTLNKNDDFPGPGKYEVDSNHHPSEPEWSFGKEIRENPIKQINKDEYPGPGKYKVVDKETGIKISFPKNEKSLVKKSDTPGPGKYRIPCRFNDINKVTRNGGAWDGTFEFV